MRVTKLKKRLMITFLSTSIIISFLLTGTVMPGYQNSSILEASSENMSSNDPSEETIEDWYFLPSYPNYAPSGLPDFDQRQHSSWRQGYSWAFCGPVALADIFWWFDSKHEDEFGTPGDGIDDYPLVKNYNTYSTPQPGPNYDDHNFNNINDVSTAWSQDPDSGELIERLATYVDIYWHKIPFISIHGTDRFQLASGARKWIKDAGLEDEYKVENIARPSFSLIADRVRQNQGVILRGGYYIPGFPKIIPLLSAHLFAVAGVHPDGYIAISDPLYDLTNKTSDYTFHNDPQYVSHDIFEISIDPPLPLIAKWWIPSFERHRRVLITSAIIISEVD